MRCHARRRCDPGVGRRRRSCRSPRLKGTACSRGRPGAAILALRQGGDPLVYKCHNLHLLGIVLPVGDGDGAIMETSRRLLVGHIALVVLLPCACGREHEAAHERAVRDAPPPLAPHPPRVASSRGPSRSLERRRLQGACAGWSVRTEAQQGHSPSQTASARGEGEVPCGVATRVYTCAKFGRSRVHANTSNRVG